MQFVWGQVAFVFLTLNKVSSGKAALLKKLRASAPISLQVHMQSQPGMRIATVCFHCRSSSVCQHSTLEAAIWETVIQGCGKENSSSRF